MVGGLFFNSCFKKENFNFIPLQNLQIFNGSPASDRLEQTEMVNKAVIDKLLFTSQSLSHPLHYLELLVVPERMRSLASVRILVSLEGGRTS